MRIVELFEAGAAGIAFLTGVWKGGSYVVRKVAAFRKSRRRLKEVWPTRPIAISHLRPDGAYVPGGLYQCLADHHALEVNYQKAIGVCPACRRRFQVMFPEPQVRAS